MAAPEAPVLPLQSWAACLTWLADRLVQAVHHSQDPAEIERLYGQAASLTSPDGRDPGMAVAVLLAACVSPDRSVEQSSRWLDELGWRLDEDAERYDREARDAS
jgi:hypothetical protein